MTLHSTHLLNPAFLSLYPNKSKVYMGCLGSVLWSVCCFINLLYEHQTKQLFHFLLCLTFLHLCCSLKPLLLRVSVTVFCRFSFINSCCHRVSLSTVGQHLHSSALLIVLLCFYDTDVSPGADVFLSCPGSVRIENDGTSISWLRVYQIFSPSNTVSPLL